MSLLILSICLGLITLALVLYQRLAPQDSSTRLFIYFAFAFLTFELLLYAYAQQSLSGAWREFLDLRYGEFNHSATFSSLLLAIAASSALRLVFMPKPAFERLFWGLLSFALGFLAADEYFMIHETLAHWELSYVLTALGLALFGGVVFWKTKPKNGLILYLGLFGGMACAAVGSIFVEEFFGKDCLGLLMQRDCFDVPVLEEAVETIGFILAASSLLLLLSPRQRFVRGAALFWLAFLLFSTWTEPVLEQQFWAEELALHFEEAQIDLVGYHLNQASFQAGDSLRLDLYWRNLADREAEYGYTVNLLDPVTGESVWRENLNIAYPATNAWFTGLIYRSHYEFILPESIQRPVAPILTVSLWLKAGESYANFQAESSSQAFFAEEFPILGQISLLSSNAAFSPSFRFSNGILLAQPELQAVNARQYRLNLQWSSEADIDEDYGYFIHFIGAEGQENLIFDRPPFANRFPTRAWTRGMNEGEEILLELPDTALGSYQVYIGLLHDARLAVTATDGSTVTDASILLGTISIP